MLNNKMQKMLETADLGRVNTYVGLFDRILLYSMATHMLPREAVEESIALCEDIVKKTINIEAASRTKFLESTVEGRLQKYKELPDGESVRLNAIKHWNIVKTLLYSNLKMDQPDKQADDEESAD